jgi:hypothetical protein
MLKLTGFIFALIAMAVTAVGQAPTLRIVQTDGPNLPAELFYGNIKVRPLRLRPGTNTAITIDDSDFYVTQQYIDFLGRFPDSGGYNFWLQELNSCGSNAACIYSRRVGVSAAFFIENEFQRTGSFVYRSFKGGLGRLPDYSEFGPDRRLVVEGPQLEQTKQAYSLAFVQRTEFLNKYAAATNADAFVDALIATVQASSGVSLAGDRASLIATYNTGSDQNQSRALALRQAIDAAAFTNAEYNRAFVLMQYFGYLRRNPDLGGFNFWQDVLNNREVNNYRGMVCAFITSVEYQERFSTATQNDRGCSTINQ